MNSSVKPGEYREPDRIEQQTAGPRVTPEDLESNIANEFYFRADEAVVGANHYAQTRNTGYQRCVVGDVPLSLMTFCILVLRNGFTVTGKSACVSPENFDVALGRKFAREDALKQLWPLLGFRLADKIAKEKWEAANPAYPMPGSGPNL